MINIYWFPLFHCDDLLLYYFGGFGLSDKNKQFANISAVVLRNVMVGSITETKNNKLSFQVPESTPQSQECEIQTTSPQPLCELLSSTCH